MGIPTDSIHDFGDGEMKFVGEVPVSYLQTLEFQALYSEEFEFFNNVLSSVIRDLFEKGDNVWVAAPPGCRRIVCAEFAILRLVRFGLGSSLIVCVVPNDALAELRRQEWVAKFERILDVSVRVLTGEFKVDLPVVKSGGIVIGTVERWNSWIHWGKDWFDFPRLVIMDEFQLIGVEGSLLETFVESLKYLRRARLVALSTTLANPRDLDKWAGFPAFRVFNFRLPESGVPFEYSLEGVRYEGFGDGMLAMTKMAYSRLKKNQSKPCLIYVPSREHAISTALSLVRYFRSESAEDPWWSSIELCVGEVRDSDLSTAISHDIGFLHEALGVPDRKQVCSMFRDGYIKVLIVASSMCWDITLSAPLVIVMGCKCYCYREKALIDCPVTDLLRMMDSVVGGSAVDPSMEFVVYSDIGQKQWYTNCLENGLPLRSLVVGEVPELWFVERLSCGEKESFRHASSTSIANSRRVHPDSVHHFQCSLKSDTNIWDMIEVLGNAEEFSFLHVLPREVVLFRELCGVFLDYYCEKFSSGVKASVYLYAHINRYPSGGEFYREQREVVYLARRLLHVMMVVCLEEGWLSTFLKAIELIRCIIQGVSFSDSLSQLPHAEYLFGLGLSSMNLHCSFLEELSKLNFIQIRRLLPMLSDLQLADVRRFINHIRSFDIRYHRLSDETNGEVIVKVVIRQRGDEKFAFAPFYPFPRQEIFYLVLVEDESKKIIDYCWGPVGEETVHLLKFDISVENMMKDYTLHVMCDSYFGLDKEFKV